MTPDQQRASDRSHRHLTLRPIAWCAARVTAIDPSRPTISPIRAYNVLERPRPPEEKKNQLYLWSSTKFLPLKAKTLTVLSACKVIPDHYFKKSYLQKGRKKTKITHKLTRAFLCTSFQIFFRYISIYFYHKNITFNTKRVPSHALNHLKCCEYLLSQT